MAWKLLRFLLTFASTFLIFFFVFFHFFSLQPLTSGSLSVILYLMNEMKETKPTYYLRDLFNVKEIHRKEIKRQQKQIQRLEWIISACVGASITLVCVLIHMIWFA